MTKQPKRTLSPADEDRIAELWRNWNALRTLREHALPYNAEGAWIREAASQQMDQIASELEAIFEETIAPKMDE